MKKTILITGGTGLVGSALKTVSTNYDYRIDVYNSNNFVESSNTLTCTTANFPLTITNISNLDSFYIGSIHLIPTNESQDIKIKV